MSRVLLVPPKLSFREEDCVSNLLIDVCDEKIARDEGLKRRRCYIPVPTLRGSKVDKEKDKEEKEKKVAPGAT